MTNSQTSNDLDLKDRELALLADYVLWPGETRHCGGFYLITPDSFASSRYGDIWRGLSEMSIDDPLEISRFVERQLGIANDPKARDAFIDLASPVESLVSQRASEIANLAYARACQAASNAVFAQFAGKADAPTFADMLAEAVNAIPRPPSCPALDESRLAAEDALKDQSEIPDRFLHIPGFVDQLVEYSMASAYTPNRVLSFAGALALLAHLMGRRYTDVNETRSNLYVLALAPTGSGKDWPLKVNGKVLQAIGLAKKTLRGSFTSGQALEELLFHSDKVLSQYDECQKLIQKIKDPNGVGQDMSEFLMKLFTAGGSTYQVRSRATDDKEQMFREVEDPSLTILGTGNAHATFRSMTRESIEEGLLGRFLIFDTDVDNPDNDFTNGRPQLPDSIVTDAREIACKERSAYDGTHSLITIEYAQGIGKRLKEIRDIAKENKKAAKKAHDEVGVALWARAPEKVTKLAMIYAVSENVNNPVVTSAALEWAWEFTKMQMARITNRITTFMSNGKVDEGCQALKAYLVRHGGTCKRREFLQDCRQYVLSDMKAIEETLVARGEMTIVQKARNSFEYRLVKQHKDKED